jgi:hypothetical protein
MPANSHYDRTLTEFAVSYLQRGGYVANLAAPPIPVARQSDRYQIYNRNDFSRDEFKPRAPGTPAEILDARMSSDTYFCQVYAGKTQIIWRERDNSDDPASYEQAKTELVMRGAAIKRERLFLAAADLNTSWDSTNRMTGHASSNASLNFIQFDATGGDPIASIQRAHTLVRQGTNGAVANTLVVGPVIHAHFMTNSAILERVKYSGGPSNPALITPQMLAAVFGVEQYLVPFSVYASNTENATAVYADVMSDNMVLMYQDRAKFSPTAIRQMAWSEYDESQNQDRASVRKWSDEAVESDWVEGQIAPAFKVVASSAGVHLSNCLT